MRRRLALSPHDLHARLQRIDVEGWDGPAATDLLGYVRENVVRIQVTAARLSGPGAEQAEATGWEAAWEVLASPAILTAPWPWSLLRTAVRRAVREEWAAGLYLTKARTAWELRAESDRPVWHSAPVSWDRLLEDGYEPGAHSPGPGGTVMGWRLVAAELRLPQWKVHRVLLVLEQAAVEWVTATGATEGDDVVFDPSDELLMLCAAT